MGDITIEVFPEQCVGTEGDRREKRTDMGAR
jgi:hypothetical protein